MKRKRVVLRTTVDERTLEFLKMVVNKAKLEKSLGRLIDKMSLIYAKELKTKIDAKINQKETITE